MLNDGPSLRGLRHLALRVKDIRKAKDFYVGFFGMKVIWEPDAENCYLSSGMDNLALHKLPDHSPAPSKSDPLDHFGFIADTPAVVDDWARWAAQNGAQIVRPPTQHRDGSYSCYLVDPDGNSIQVLYEPTISRL